MLLFSVFMTKHHDLITDEEYRAWFAGLERNEQLAHARELRADLAADATESDAELAEMDDSIAFVELASYFERGNLSVSDIPALEAIEMMWDWLCDICEDDFAKAREMGIEIDTAKRWSRLLNALYLKSVEHDQSVRSSCVHSLAERTSKAHQ